MDKGGIVQMAKLVAFYSRADENYFGGSMKYIQIGNTEKAAKMIADMTGADLFRSSKRFPMPLIIIPALHRQKRINRQENDQRY